MESFFLIQNSGETIAMILKAGYTKEGVSFFTPNHFSQQLGYMAHPKGKVIEPHTHNSVTRTVTYTQEVLFIRSGKLRADFYTEDQVYIESVVLSAGDVILLASGGHGFECLEPTEMIEVKQGPYSGDLDKQRFNPIEKDNLIVHE